MPGVSEEGLDPNTLVIQGIVIGPNVCYALVSGQIFGINDRIGLYTIKKIEPGKITLGQLEEEYILKLEGYSKTSRGTNAQGFYVEFVNAELKKALTMLAKADGMNIIVPESTAGKVSVSFYKTDPLKVIASILRVNDLEYAVEGGIMRVGTSEQFKDGSDLKAISIPLKYATAKDLETKIKTFLSDRGQTVSDERTNVIIVKDKANVIDNVVSFLNSIDKQDPQVSIEAKVIDASQTFSRALGVQWGMTSGPNNVIVQGNQDAGTITNGANTGTLTNLPATSPTSGLDILVGRLPGNTTLEMQLSAAEANGNIRIISKPNVTTINNKPAVIRSGVKLYVKVEGGSDEGPTLQEIDTGIELKVTPQITLNRMIKMTIEATQSEADFSRTVDNIPAILDNTASTTVLIPDGETAVIGGLLKVNATTENKGVPGVSRIPILGWLFKSSSKTKANKELMIFLTPKILDQSFFKIEPAGLDRKKTGTGDVGIVSPNL
jgi:type IV pilus assembly protein PilQ